jgi:hypothetical protein
MGFLLIGRSNVQGAREGCALKAGVSSPAYFLS